MSPENTPNTTKICPTCGTRLGINATRCSVCGSNLAASVTVATNKAVEGPRIPQVTLSLPVVFGLAVLLLVIGAGVVFGVLQAMGDKSPVAAVQATVTFTPSLAATVTHTPTITPTETIAPTATVEPPIEYKVALGDSCLAIAFTFGVSQQSIQVLNGINCDVLTVGQTLKIPRPTPTASPAPTKTLNATEMARAECTTTEYIVKDGDTLGGIAGAYGVLMEAVRNYNGMPSDIVFTGQKLIIPLCEQNIETRTPTPVPPYPAAPLLLPADGTSFMNPSEVVTLQWASVGTLRQTEAYAITVEDVTAGEARRWVEYVTDTKFIVPANYGAVEASPHVFRWSVLPVRQNGTDKASGQPIWEPAGDVSIQRVFSWMGGGPGAAPAPIATDTPNP